MKIYLKDLINNEDWKEYLLDILKTNTHVDFYIDNKKVFKNTRIKQILINTFFLRIMVKYNQPITELPIGEKDTLSKGKINSILSKIYRDEINKGKQYNEIYTQMSDDFWKVENELMNFIMTDCIGYSRSIDILGISDIINTDKFKKTFPINDYDFDNMSIHEAEKISLDMQDKLNDYLAKNESQFTPFCEMGMFNIKQMNDILIAIGFKTDINDRILPKFIKDNYANGIKDNAGFVAESMASKKASHYNKQGTPPARYLERRVGLLSSSMRKIYPGDCGTPFTIPVKLTRRIYKRFVGKVIIENHNKVTLTEDNIKNYVDKVIHMRSVVTCKHTDGVCEVCMGLMSFYVPRAMAPGIIATCEGISPVSQAVMSTKHVQQVIQVKWEPSDKTIFKYFTVRDDDIYVSKNGKGYQLGLSIDSVKTFLNIHYRDKDDVVIDETIIPKIPEMVMYKNGQYHEGPINLKDSIQPYLSLEFIERYRQNPDIIQQLDYNLIIIDLDKVMDIPILTVDKLNQSTLSYFKRVEHMFEQVLYTCTTCEEALNLAMDRFWERSAINVVFIEILVKACMVTDSHNYAIPEVTDPLNVKFGKILDINMFRSLSVSLTHERLLQVINNVDIYNGPITPNDYDRMIIMNDMV